jgi:hypothetical protein
VNDGPKRKSAPPNNSCGPAQHEHARTGIKRVTGSDAKQRHSKIPADWHQARDEPKSKKAPALHTCGPARYEHGRSHIKGVIGPNSKQRIFVVVGKFAGSARQEHSRTGCKHVKGPNSKQRNSNIQTARRGTSTAGLAFATRYAQTQNSATREFFEAQRGTSTAGL